MKINAIRSCMMKLTSCCIFVVTTCALTTVTQAQNKTLQYLRNTPASLYDVGMMRLEAKLNDLKKYSHLGYPELMSLPTFIYARETDEFRFVILESGYEEIDTVRQDCKKAIIAIKNLVASMKKGSTNTKLNLANMFMLFCQIIVMTGHKITDNLALT